MLDKIKPANSLIGLLALYFALGYAVATVAHGTKRDASPPPGELAGTPSAVAVPPAAPAVAVALAPVGQPAVAPTPTPAPTAPVVAQAAPPPAPVPAVQSPPAPAARPQPAPTPPQPAPAPRTSADTAAAPPDDQIWRVPVNPEDAQLGPKDALATVVIFSAFGCPTCGLFQDAPPRLAEKYGKKVRVVFKHKVVPEQHPDALPASIAALAAKEQGKFWEYHDLLFKTNQLDPASLKAHAAALGLDATKFEKDRQNDKLRGQTLKDSLLANEVGAHSMPNVLVNGVRMRGAKEWANLEALVAEELAKAEKAVAAGTKAADIYQKAIATGKAFPQLESQKNAFNTTQSPFLGAANAKIEIVVFEDFECPFCAKIGPQVKAFQTAYPEQVKFVFKHMPLTSIHPSAQLASEAAVEAQEQGKFWEYHDVLFNNQKALARENLEQYAQQVGLDVEKLKQALNSGKHKARIAADMQDAQRAGVTGTPSVYLNGQKYQGPRGYPPEGLEAVARAYLGME